MSNTQNNSRGLQCPKCAFTIKFTMESLLHSDTVKCPSCGLSMEMHVPREMKVHLQEIHLAEKMIEQAKTFKR